MTSAVPTVLGGTSCKPSYWKVEAGSSELKVNLRSQVEGNLGYLRRCLKLHRILIQIRSRRFNQAVVSCSMHSCYVKMFNSRITQSTNASLDWKDLIWQSKYWKLGLRYNGKKKPGLQNKTRGIDISHDLLLGKGKYAEL